MASRCQRHVPKIILTTTLMQWSGHRRISYSRYTPTSILAVTLSRLKLGHLKTVALSRYPDIEVEIFEAAEKLAEIGAGIGLFSRKW